MEVTIDDVKKKYEDVLSNKISREEAGRWAYSLMQHLEHNELQFIPPQEENKIWDLIMYLYGVDNQISPSQYTLSRDDILNKFKDIFQ